jgi:hypothetical protein
VNRDRALVATITAAIMVIVLASLSLRIDSGMRFVLFALAVLLVAASSAGLVIAFQRDVRKRSRGKHAAPRETAARDTAPRQVAARETAPADVATLDAGRPTSDETGEPPAR